MSVRVHIVLDDDLAERLKLLAQQQDRALSRQVAFMLKAALQEENPRVERLVPPPFAGVVPVPDTPDTAPDPEDPWWERPQDG
jgi:hypothetical protein